MRSGPWTNSSSWSPTCWTVPPTRARPTGGSATCRTDRPAPAPALIQKAPARKAPPPAALTGVPLAGGAVLLVPGRPDPDDLTAIQAAAGPLLDLLAARGLLHPEDAEDPADRSPR